MSAAVDLAGQRQLRFAAAHVESACTLGSVVLVPGERQEIDPKLVHVEGNLARSLRRVGVQEDAARLRDGANFSERLQYADLVVCRHHRDEDRAFGDRSLQLVEVDEALCVDPQPGHPAAFALEPLARVEHRFVLGRHGDDVIAAIAEGMCDALDGEVVRFGRPAGEDDLLR